MYKKIIIKCMENNDQISSFKGTSKKYVHKQNIPLTKKRTTEPLPDVHKKANKKQSGTKAPRFGGS